VNPNPVPKICLQALLERSLQMSLRRLEQLSVSWRHHFGAAFDACKWDNCVGVVARDTRTVIFGRDADADRVGRSQAPVLLVTGDSGIGKTTVLQMSCAERPGWVSPDPLTFPYSTGALHATFHDSLAQALTKLVEAGVPGESLAERLAEAARRLSNERVGVFARVALAELVAFLRGRFGDELGKATERFARDIWPDDAESLAAKLLGARDPLAAEVLAGFAAAAAEIAGEFEIALSFDAGERLGPEDLRLLRDLAVALPRRVHLRLAYATDHADRSRAVTELKAHEGIDEVEIGSLASAAAEEWLEHEGVDEGDRARLIEQTAAYPLLLEAAVAHLRAGGTITDIPRHQQLAARTRTSWVALAPGAAAVARSVAVLPDPLREEDMRRIAGVSTVGEWATVIDELCQARIFSVEVNGQPWFHAERRAFVLRECLTDEQRDEAASTAAAVVFDSLKAYDFAGIVAYAELVALASELQREQPQLAAVLGLSDEALSVAAALLELATEHIIAEADSLFSHALRFIGEIADPAAVLDELQRSSLVAVRTFDNGSLVIVRAAWSPPAGVMIAGRTALRLGKPAVLELAQFAFNTELRTRLGTFVSAEYGIGNPTIAGLARVASGAQLHSGYVNRRQLGCNLLILGTLLGDAAFYCAARYANERDREEAESALRGFVADTAAGEVRVTTVARHPLEAVPTERFASAFFRATGARRQPHERDIQLPPPEGVDDEALAERRVHTARWLRERSSAHERLALELDRGYVLAWNASDDLWDECVIRTDGDDEARHIPALEASFRDAYDALRVRQTLRLGSAEQYRTRSTHWGQNPRREPISTEISYRRTQSRTFNNAQPKVAVTLDEQSLQPLLETAFRRELEDARAMLQELPLDEAR
jgi:hypothetical protein